MKKLGIVGLNYGYIYQSFIPFYIYSALKSQPESDVLVFSENKLESNVKKMLNLISGSGEFEIVEEYQFGVQLKDLKLFIPEYKRALRWLFYDNKFDKYETLYFGDTDIFFCSEKKSIYEQHIRHCQTINLPYSNYLRAGKLPINIKKLIFIMLRNKNFKINYFFHTLRRKVLPQNMLSGLHFVKTYPYFEKITPNFDFFIKYMVEGNHTIQWMYNESILYELILKSGIGLPPICPSSPDLDSLHPENIGYRPHHGIHLGIFRDEKNLINERQILQSYVYQSYFKDFYLKERNTDIFNNLFELASPFVQRIFECLINYCSSGEHHFYEET